MSNSLSIKLKYISPKCKGNKYQILQCGPTGIKARKFDQFIDLRGNDFMFSYNSLVLTRRGAECPNKNFSCSFAKSRS